MGALGCLVGALVIPEGSADAVADELLPQTGATNLPKIHFVCVAPGNFSDGETDSSYSEIGNFRSTFNRPDLLLKIVLPQPFELFPPNFPSVSKVIPNG